ncbi:NAD-dependent succinate-semialdehyde dehydrogenase [Flavobacterium johnsoniae]|uniref:NAD-dependent succinate-semialdehyde dehydrogenase n=1 Tax=Flavobacterium johnsoniae TaxID=986 RepID=UPI003D95DBBF
MITSINPYTSEKVFEIREFNDDEIQKALDIADELYKSWKETSFAERAALMKSVGDELRKNIENYAAVITSEMGKPISESAAEIEKCAKLCDYYAENAEKHLADKEIETEAYRSYVKYEPIGVVLAIMPWNYPFWQVFRFAVPGLMAGNTAVLKHASNVMNSAQNIEDIFKKAGFPQGCFTNLPVSSAVVEKIIKNPIVKAVTLTGSEKAGRSVAAAAGSEIKKTVLELGGSNALIVFADCNLNETVKSCVLSRFQNAGQSCIAGKRLLVEASIVNEFKAAFIEQVKQLKQGDPMDKQTSIATMARVDLAEELEGQLKKSVEMGAKILLGGKRENASFEPTVLDNVTPDMPLFQEETFGPVIGITTFDTDQQAVDLANESSFGLGVSLYTEDLDRAYKLIPKFDDGAVFVNEIVKSDQRLPFGGTKNSGYGRELSIDGIQEFVNKKTVYIKKY